MKGSKFLSALAIVVLAAIAALGAGSAAAAQKPAARAINPAGARLMIVHVQKGCHLWSNGARQAATLSLKLRPGGTLTVSNVDVDMHQLVQLGGPKVSLPGPLMMGVARAIHFSRPGVYRFQTKVVQVEGMGEMMNVETTGPDHVLRLTVLVA